jgi:hypothetical protein
MRGPHGRKPGCAVSATGRAWYRGDMKPTTTFVRPLRHAAAIVLLAGLAVWAFTGAHTGWTQTSVVEIRRDEITGIDFPVRRDAFVAGVEVPLGAGGVAAFLVALSFLPRWPALRRARA